MLIKKGDTSVGSSNENYCPVCFKYFKSKEAVEKHINWTHKEWVKEK